MSPVDNLSASQRLAVVGWREPPASQERAQRVLASILSGACTVAPAPGAFSPAVHAVLTAAADAKRLAVTAAKAPRTQPRRAIKARPAAAQPYAAEARGWVNPTAPAVRLADVTAPAALAAAATVATRGTLAAILAGAKVARQEARKVARLAAGRPTKAEAEAQAAAWAVANPAEALWGPPAAPEPGPKVGLGDNSFWAATVAALLCGQ